MDTKTRLAYERKKRDLLMEKLRECETIISALESLESLERAPDDFDKALESKISPKSGTSVDGERHTKSEVPQQDIKEQVLRRIESTEMRVRKDSVWPKFLGMISGNGATLDELDRFAQTLDKPPTRAGIRNMMMQLRNNGYAEDTGVHGFYRASKKGEEFLAALKSETPSVGAEGVSGSTQAAVARGFNLDDLL